MKTLQCPKCSNRYNYIKASPAWIKNHDVFACPQCGRFSDVGDCPRIVPAANGTRKKLLDVEAEESDSGEEDDKK